MSIRSAISRLVQLAAAVLTLSVTAPSLAQGTLNPGDPVGVWEVKVSGRVQEESIRGTAYVTFDTSGSLSGYMLPRGATELVGLSGDWQRAASAYSFRGSVIIGQQNFSLQMDGAARTGVSIYLWLRDGLGGSLKLSGKPLTSLVDASGTYSGTVVQNRLTGDIELTFVQGTQPGVYTITGTSTHYGWSSSVTGLALVDRSNRFVAYIYNPDQDFFSSLSGKLRPGISLATSGISLGDGSRFTARMTTDGG